MMTVTKKMLAAVRKLCRRQFPVADEFEVGHRNSQGESGDGCSVNCLLDGEDSDLDDVSVLDDLARRRVPDANGVVELDVYAFEDGSLAGNVCVLLLWDGRVLAGDPYDRRAASSYQAEFCQSGRRFRQA